MAISRQTREVVKRSRNKRIPVLEIGTSGGGSSTTAGSAAPSGNYANLLTENSFNENQAFKKNVKAKTFTVGDWVAAGTTIDVEVYNSGFKINADKLYLNDFLIERSAAGVLDLEGDVNVNGDLNIYGDIIQNGAAYETHAEKLYTTNDLIISRDGAVAGLAVGEYSGLKVYKYDGTNNLLFGVDKDGWGRIGDEGGTMLKLATLTDTIADNTLIQYNNTNNYFYGSNLLLNNLTVNGLYVDYSSAHKIYLNPNGDSYLKGGKLGIGTDLPSTALHIKGSAYQLIKIDRTENASINNAYYIGSSYSGATDCMWLGLSSTHFVLDENSRVGIGTQTPATTLDVNGTGKYSSYVYFGGNIGTNPFTSGFAGSGWQIDSTGAGTLKSLTVREALNVYELNINKIRSGNGSYWFSDGGKVKNVTNIGDGYYRLYFDSSEENVFSSYDIVRCQVWTGSGIKYYELETSGLYDDYIKCEIANKDGISEPESGDEIVRVGNRLVSDRRGAIYITSNDDDSPYMDVVYGKNAVGGTFTTKVRLGNLDGITDTTAGLDGTQSNYYGLYTNNGHFSGHIHSTTGNIGGWSISTSYINKNYLYLFSNNTQGGSIGLWDGTPQGWETISIVKSYSGSSDRVFLHMGETYSAGWTGRFGFSLTPSKTANSYFEFSRSMSTGALTAQIAGWTFNTASLYKIEGSAEIAIGVPTTFSSSIVGIQTGTDIDNRIYLGAYSSNYYLGCKKNGNTQFLLGSTTNQIASWNFNETYLYTGTLQTSDAYTSTGITIGNGAIRSKYFRVDTDGSVYGSNLQLSGRFVTEFDSVITLTQAQTTTLTPSTNNKIYSKTGATSITVTLAKGTGTWTNGQIFRFLLSGEGSVLFSSTDFVIRDSRDGNSTVYLNAFNYTSAMQDCIYSAMYFNDGSDDYLIFF